MYIVQYPRRPKEGVKLVVTGASEAVWELGTGSICCKSSNYVT